MTDYTANPLAEEMQARDPRRYDAVSKVAGPPKMFANGTADVPAFTASGIDPQHLLKLPGGMRHAAATNPDINQVYDWFETYAGMPDAEVDTPGLRDAKLRVERWLTETDIRPPEQIAAEQAEEQAWFEGYQRSLSGDGLLPEEREANRRAQWDEKQAADQSKRDAAADAARDRQARSLAAVQTR